MERYNLGSGAGTSVMQLLAVGGRLAGAPIPHSIEEPRPGDPAILVADIAKARHGLGWMPRHSGIQEILATAFRWHSQVGLRRYEKAENETPRRVA